MGEARCHDGGVVDAEDLIVDGEVRIDAGVQAGVQYEVTLESAWRCMQCNRLLARVTMGEGTLEVECPECGIMNGYLARPGRSMVNAWGEERQDAT